MDLHGRRREEKEGTSTAAGGRRRGRTCTTAGGRENLACRNACAIILIIVFVACGHNIAKPVFVELWCYGAINLSSIIPTFIGADMDLPCHKRLIPSSTPGVQNEQL